MLLPQPDVTEHHPDELPTEFRCLSAFAPLMAAGREERRATRTPGALPAGTPEPAVPAAPDRAMLERFQRLMAAEGWPVQITRMAEDPRYARERMALGQGSASWHLRQLAAQLMRSHDPSAALH
jgi:predicted TIM-barrel fold metal-dependent hydrolase